MNPTLLRTTRGSQSESENVETSRIRVLIRARPLNKIEIGRGAKNVLERQSEQQITVWDPACFDLASRAEINDIDPACWSRSFTFDKTLWSLDKADKDYASQDVVYETVGSPVLKLVLDGFNCCVFAFGQTGSGKTLTMMGENVTGGDPDGYGLIPRICFELFDALESKSARDGCVETVDFSHLEIYNENIKDLLAPTAQQFLKVREHPQNGVFVSGLTVVRVTKFEDVMSLIAIGDKSRSVAYTNMNAHSSRSHAIVTLTVCQRTRKAQKKNDLPTSALQQKVARLHLVDLAGSERVALSGATGTRLREAGNINRSLSVLGDVIKSLGDSRSKPTHIPYRNSSLTMVLKDSLGGNSHVFMLATISPSSFDYEETVSTLKFAERAKRVRLRVEANVTSGLLASDRSAVELVPLLQAEVAKLRQLLKIQEDENANKRSELAAEEQSHFMIEMRQRVRELEQQLQDREDLIRSLETAKTSDVSMLDESIQQNEIHARDFRDAHTLISSAVSRGIGSPTSRNQPVVVLSEDAVDTALPRVINLNQDPLFSECLVYYIAEGEVMAGCSEDLADILLTGPDIYPQHCIFKHEKGEVFLQPTESAQVFVNGKVMDGSGMRSVKLNNCDRISLGRFHLFRFEAKGESRRSGGTSVKSKGGEEYLIPDWEFAQAELMAKSEAYFQLRSSKEFQSLRNELSTIESSSSASASVSATIIASPASPMDSKYNDAEAMDIWWEKLNRVAAGNEEATGPEELQEMMRSVVDKAEAQMNNRRNKSDTYSRNINDFNSSSSAEHDANKKRVTFDLNNSRASVASAIETTAETRSTDRKVSGYVSIQQKAVANSNLKSSLRQDNSFSSAALNRPQAHLPSAPSAILQPTKSETIHSGGNFEQEARALQEELAEMQRNLKDRMQRYNKLSTFHLPN